MSVFTTGGGKPTAPDVDKLLEGAVGVVAGGTPAVMAVSDDIDGFSVLHCGANKDTALVVSVTAAAGFTIGGDGTQVVLAGGSVSITFDDNPGDGNAVAEITVTAVDLSTLAAAAVPTLGSALAAAAATEEVPYVINTIES